MRLSAAALPLLAVLANAGIYPEGHFDLSTELTVDTFDSFVKTEVDAGRTLFVRWIASEGWGWWRKQAPAWNNIVKKFAGNPDVSFGDINLSKQPIRGNHNPGRGGWPTVRYFNKKTGYEGAAYDKKTSKAMCDELGDDKYMQQYVEEAGQTSLCSAATGAGCSDKEKKFIDKFKPKPLADVEAQIARLTRMSGGRMKPSLQAWISQRLAILRQIVRAAGKDEL